MFISRIQAAGEDRSPFGDFWFEPISSRTVSGGRVSSETAMQLSAVFRAVGLLSGHIAMLPLVLKKQDSLARIKTHSLLKLFKKPNKWQNGLEWRQMLQGHLLLRGNAYNEIIDNARGEILQLIPLHPDRVKIVQMPDGDYNYRISDTAGNERTLMRGQVWHLRGLSSNGIFGISVIECARESMGLGLAAQSYGSRFFANDARPAGGWIEYPGKFADRAARTQFRESVQEAQAASNRGKMMVLDQGMQYHEVGLNNKDSQFLESRQFQIGEIARWFGVPPHKLSELSRSTNNNIEQQALEYITDALMIWTEIWEASIEDALLFDDENIEVEFDFRKLQRGDSMTRFSNYAKGIAAGWLTRNEARADDGREPLPGLDDPLRPLNMIEESDAEDQEADAEALEPPGQEAKEPMPDGETADENARRLQSLVQGNAERLARRIVKSGLPGAQLVADSLAVSQEVAEQFFATLRPGITLENLTAALIELGRTS